MILLGLAVSAEELTPPNFYKITIDDLIGIFFNKLPFKHLIENGKRNRGSCIFDEP